MGVLDKFLDVMKLNPDDDDDFYDDDFLDDEEDEEPVRKPYSVRNQTMMWMICSMIRRIVLLRQHRS